MNFPTRLVRADLDGPAGAWRRLIELSRTAIRPLPVFLLLSILFGPAIIALTPPMRGADEPAHFIRAYGISQGEIVPAITDDEGRKGIYIPEPLQRQMAVFELARYRVYVPDFAYRPVFAEYQRLAAQRSAGAGERAVFNLYGGSEGYSPVAYLPYLPAVLIGRLNSADFLPLIYAMRASGFVLLTGLMACAIAIVPRLGWAFVLIAMLPSSLFARATLSGDDTALALAMLVAAVSLRGALSPGDGAPWRSAWARSLWMVLCTLAKPPHIAFVALEAMRWPFRRMRRRWGAAAIVVVPALALPVLWATISAADVAAWRLTDGSDIPPHYFDPLWKLGFMIEQPLHFPTLVVGNVALAYDYWQQLIGVLGWRDTPLQAWCYPLLTLCLVAVMPGPLGGDRWTRLRIGLVAAGGALAYSFAVFLIFYLAWTHIDAPNVQGVQGRYFVVALPLVAIALSAFLNRGLTETARAWATVLGATLSGVAVIEAVLRTDWKVVLLPV